MISFRTLFRTVFAQPFLFVLLLTEALAVVALGLEQLDEVRLAVPAVRASETQTIERPRAYILPLGAAVKLPRDSVREHSVHFKHVLW